MEVQKSTEKCEAEKFGSTASRIHNFSTVHGSLPEDYVPEWKRNIEFRNENIRLAKDYGIAWSTHGDTSFLGYLRFIFLYKTCELVENENDSKTVHEMLSLLTLSGLTRFR